MFESFSNVLSTPFRRKAAAVYWLVACIVAGVWSYTEQKDYLATCNIVEGKVVDKLWLRVGRHDEWCPQISYKVNGEENFFADKSGSAQTGDKVKVIYEKNNILNARVYTFLFWFNLRVIILTFLIAFVLFGLVWGLTQKFPDTIEILPSNSEL